MILAANSCRLTCPEPEEHQAYLGPENWLESLRRLIFSLLALANLRQALAEHGRAETLDRNANEALVRAPAQVVRADNCDQRAGWRERLIPMR